MKGVFCIEGFWYGDHRDKTSVYPVLELINRIEGLPYIHHRSGTVEEFTFSIERWKTKAFHSKYPILYLAFHGDKGLIKVGKTNITLESLAKILGTKCEGVVIYFGSCETMQIDKRLLQKFMEQTKVLAVMGFKQEVNWLRSASFDIQMLSYFIENKFDSKGIEKTYNQIQENCKSLINELQFRMEINERIWFPRKRI
ncbi:MAG: hypothetical protein KBB37_03150 [Bacteroidia bacterium]|nr:hypothetical protein [Bacteroidia bacterium]MBP7260260.1 hypothetical protein [Bacteroidia bacterium]MBP9180544.1 hypothetical protein [Bacteroidia bacterium]MBP9724506.1 hypothetical protein [Bacteroidia bacterium]